MPEIERIDDAYIDAVIKASEIYDPNLDVTQGIRLRELIKLMRDHIEQQGDLSQYQTKLSFDDTPTIGSDNPVTSAGVKAYADELGTNVKGGVQSEGDTLKKLYDLVVSSLAEVTVETVVERDAYNVGHLPLHIFVKNDGDGNWALYKALTTGVNAQYVKLSDPDTFNSVMNASQIKAAYESNSDTNALTDSLLLKLNSLNDSYYYLNRVNHTGTQTASTISDFEASVNMIIGKLTATSNYKASAYAAGSTYTMYGWILNIVSMLSNDANKYTIPIRDVNGQIEGGTGMLSATQLARRDYVDGAILSSQKDFVYMYLETSGSPGFTSTGNSPTIIKLNNAISNGRNTGDINSGGYIAPVSGYYMVNMKMGLVDNAPAGIDFCCNVYAYSGYNYLDSTPVWFTTSGVKNSATGFAVVKMDAGKTLYFCYQINSSTPPQIMHYKVTIQLL